jgi:hypothetical protein
MRRKPMGISLRRYLTGPKVTRQDANDKIETRFSQPNHDGNQEFFKINSLSFH